MGYISIGAELREAFERHHLDPINDLLFARITYWNPMDDPESVNISLRDTGDGSLNMSEEEFYNALDRLYIEKGYGMDPVTGTVWLTDHKLFIRQEYDGWGHWQFVDPVPPEDIDPQGLWLK